MTRFVVFGATLLACGSGQPAPGQETARVLVFTDWIRVEASCGYAFRAPPDTMAEMAVGTDSCVERWITGGGAATGGCVYTGDYGGFSSNLREYQEAEGYSEYEETPEVIDGREARLVTVSSEEFLLAGVHFPQLAAELEGIGLTVEARCQRKAGQLDALGVFRSITLPR
ncbi:MAG: hypothetical protein RL685_676 [Pseudomonadota bacterium]|jgi:hypothetical protein